MLPRQGPGFTLKYTKFKINETTNTCTNTHFIIIESVYYNYPMAMPQKGHIIKEKKKQKGEHDKRKKKFYANKNEIKTFFWKLNTNIQIHVISSSGTKQS